jgi:hypothetical protein
VSGLRYAARIDQIAQGVPRRRFFQCPEERHVFGNRRAFGEPTALRELLLVRNGKQFLESNHGCRRV